VAASLVPLFASIVDPGVRKAHISKLYNYSLYISFVLFAPVSMYLAFFAKEITYLALGLGYPTAQYYLPIVSIGLLLMLVSDYTTSLLVGRNKVKPIMKYGTLAYLLEVLLLLLLVPTFKGYGMVVTVSLLLPATLLLFYHRAIAKELGVKLHTRRTMKVVATALAATLLVFLISLLVPPVSLVNDVGIIAAAAAAIIIIYPPLLAATGTMGRKDVEIIKKLSVGIPLAGKVLYLLTEYAGMFTGG
jgi:O-antigen/teichoic acid export membrane protein